MQQFMRDTEIVPFFSLCVVELLPGATPAIGECLWDDCQCQERVCVFFVFFFFMRGPHELSIRTGSRCSVDWTALFPVVCCLHAVDDKAAVCMGRVG